MEDWKTYLLENVNCEKIQSYKAFQTLLETGRVELNDDCFIEIKKNTVREENDDEYDLEDEEEESPYLLVYLPNGEYFEEETEIIDWQENSRDRLRIVTGDMAHPNQDVQDRLEEFFHYHYHYTHLLNSGIDLHYSNLDENQVAINIKCDEYFAHEGLLKHGIVSWDTESEHRSFSLDSFMEDLPHREETKDLAFLSYEQQGSSGGYLVITLEELLYEPVEWIATNVQRLAKENAEHYQKLENYEWCIDEMEAKIQRLTEEKNEQEECGLDTSDLDADIKELTGYLQELKTGMSV